MNTIANICVKISPSRRYYDGTILMGAMFDLFNELVITFWFSESSKNTTITIRFPTRLGILIDA
jgi:hypothetical protein